MRDQTAATVAKVKASAEFVKSLPLEQWVMEDAEPDVTVVDGRVRVYVADNYGDDAEYLTPDQAEELARELLDAAKEARGTA